MRTFMIVVVAVALSACSSGLKRPVQEVVVRSDTDGVQRVEVVAHSYWFEPNRIVVRSGVPVEIKLRNAGWLVPHNMSCMATEAGLEFDADLSMFHGHKTVRFTPGTPGEYKFFCRVRGHSKKGMTGMLVVQR